MNLRTILGFAVAVVVFITVLLLITPWILSLVGYSLSTGGIEFLLIRAFVLLVSVAAASFVYHLIKGQELERSRGN